MSHRDLTDRQLVARSAAGDTDAFRLLFDRKHRRVYRIVYQIVGDPARAEDVTQEVFLSLWQHCGRYRSEFAVDTWLTRIATNRAIDRWRSARTEKRRRVEVEGEPERLSHVARAAARRGARGAPDDIAAWRQLQAIWDELAELLPPQQRAAFALREIEGLASAEVAEALDCSASTVRSHVAEARAKLQQALRERYPELARVGS